MPPGFSSPWGLAKTVSIILSAARVANQANQPFRFTLWAFFWQGALQLFSQLYRQRLHLLLRSAAKKYDVFILASAKPFVDEEDFDFLKSKGKTLVFVFHGSDHRPPRRNGIYVADAMQSGDWSLLDNLTKLTKDRVALAERYGDLIVALPSSAQFHQKTFINYLSVGIPFKPSDNLRRAALKESKGPPLVLHAPSSRYGKGSLEIANTIQRLEEDGLNFHYKSVRVPHTELLKRLTRANIVVDQLYSDTPMATFAAEASALGKPCIVGGYAWKFFQRLMPEEELPPTHLIDRPPSSGPVAMLV